MSFDIEKVKADCKAADSAMDKLHGGVCNDRHDGKDCYVCRCVNDHLPDAIELIEEAEDLLLDARPVVGGEREAAWRKRLEAFFVKVRGK